MFIIPLQYWTVFLLDSSLFKTKPSLFWWPFSLPKHKSVNDGSISTSLPLPSQHLIKP